MPIQRILRNCSFTTLDRRRSLKSSGYVSSESSNAPVIDVFDASYPQLLAAIAALCTLASTTTSMPFGATIPLPTNATGDSRCQPLSGNENYTISYDSVFGGYWPLNRQTPHREGWDVHRLVQRDGVRHIDASYTHPQRP